MTWDEALECVSLEPVEIALTQARDFVSFMRTCDLHGRSALQFAVCRRGGVDFHLDKDVEHELDPFRTFRWMKTMSYLMSCQKDPESVAAVTVAQYPGGLVEWGITSCGGFRWASENLDDCARRICARLLESVRPEPVRKLESDLTGRRFVSDAEIRKELAV